MGDLNQVQFLKNNLPLTREPVLEIGGRDYGNTPDYRGFFSKEGFLGIDQNSGDGVDLTLDFLQDFSEIEKALGGRRFKTVICFSVLEHCKNLSRMCDNIQRILAGGGVLLVSVPFVWEYHGFPEDYWRFTPKGIEALFPGISFEVARTRISTTRAGELFEPKDNEFLKIDYSPRVGIQKGRYSCFDGFFLKFLQMARVLRPVLGYLYVMPPVMIHMVGIKKAPLDLKAV